ncbi:MAG: rhamnulose-1-phosphate aldolase [Bacteroidetes bacterium]|nr:MAG: rhamnulose-1-phosphate aldolase [Bacteroidota bacterium]RLD82528.1 MAG: rhamnulose-1-phosphate aldolase [Bacteroidota bacterium]
MKFLDKYKGLKPSAKEMAAVAEYLWHKGWAERNAGNMSVRLGDMIVDPDVLKDAKQIPLDRAYPSLAGQFLLLSGSDTRMRNLAKKPAKNTCLIHIGEEGKDYRIFKDAASILPTSELPTHLAIHQQLIWDGRKEKALLHTHVNEVIALTQIAEYCSKDSIDNLLWGMHPETIMFIPDGIGFVPYTLPGTDEIAEKTLRALKGHRVIIWEKHGCLAVGEDLFECFDQIDILAKSANIFFTCRNAGFEAEGMTTEQLNEIKNINNANL